MIQIIPAIDLIDGKCVRLTEGRFDSKKIYDEDPVAVAKKFEETGLKRLHLVDLDGARWGALKNQSILKNIADSTGLEIDFGGGIRSDRDVELAFRLGASQINCGSIAVEQEETLISWLKKYGSERIILAADIKDGFVVHHGWQETTGQNVVDFISRFQKHGIENVTVTDTSKDGQLQGPAFDSYKEIMVELPWIKLIASGGVTSLREIENLQELGCHGVIVGKAIYEGWIKLDELKEWHAD